MARPASSSAPTYPRSTTTSSASVSSPHLAQPTPVASSSHDRQLHLLTALRQSEDDRLSLEGVRGSILSPTSADPSPQTQLPPSGRNRTPSSISSRTTHSASSLSSYSSSSSSSLPLDAFLSEDPSLDPEASAREMMAFRQELGHVHDPETLRQLILDRERDLRQAALIGLSLTRRHQEMEMRLSELAEEGYLPPPEDILPPFPSCSSPPIGHSSLLSSRDESFEVGSEEWSSHGPPAPSAAVGAAEGPNIPQSPRLQAPDQPQSPRLQAPHPFSVLRAASRSPRYPRSVPSPIGSPSPSADTSWNGLGDGGLTPLSPRSPSARHLVNSMGRGGAGRHRPGRRQSVGHGGGGTSGAEEVDYVEVADLHFRSINRQNAELRRELEAFREEFQTFRKELSTVNGRIDDLSRDITDQRKRGNADSRRLGDMEGDLAEAAGAVDHLKTQFLLVKDGQRAHVSDTKGAVKEAVIGMRKSTQIIEVLRGEVGHLSQRQLYAEERISALIEEYTALLQNAQNTIFTLNESRLEAELELERMSFPGGAGREGFQGEPLHEIFPSLDLSNSTFPLEDGSKASSTLAPSSSTSPSITSTSTQTSPLMQRQLSGSRRDRTMSLLGGWSVLDDLRRPSMGLKLLLRDPLAQTLYGGWGEMAGEVGEVTSSGSHRLTTSGHRATSPLPRPSSASSARSRSFSASPSPTPSSTSTASSSHDGDRPASTVRILHAYTKVPSPSPPASSTSSSPNPSTSFSPSLPPTLE
ncbi:hypothetical protein BJ684DRAFT_20839 [Piptocephalis cylindrospora]|uniref:Uncharacterized protein n=1 Tax=Piptocephalis cylindrospora TaxID=1907219 RepID=A0A4P9Y1V2_9FUNG|nr:hypothetical protein BJ684DRAFT_20839 [Piptocephalis cylindrospora]|eukprot:RKP12634.1 hypothetical protein BJ684DRAFT_20839 [Piptocephalis cylindrospora]